MFFIKFANNFSIKIKNNFYKNLLLFVIYLFARISYFFNEWVLSTNHRRLAILYFVFIILTGFVGLILATIIRIELAYPGQCFLTQNAERYLTLISVHGIVMVFFVVIPLIFGAFANFLLPTQLGVRDVAFPRLNSFMFWLTPSGFVLLIHIFLFDRSYTLTHWLNYGELKNQLRRRYSNNDLTQTKFVESTFDSLLAWRLLNLTSNSSDTRGYLLHSVAPSLENIKTSLFDITSINDTLDKLDTLLYNSFFFKIFNENLTLKKSNFFVFLLSDLFTFYLSFFSHLLYIFDYNSFLNFSNLKFFSKKNQSGIINSGDFFSLEQDLTYFLSDYFFLFTNKINPSFSLFNDLGCFIFSNENLNSSDYNVDANFLFLNNFLTCFSFNELNNEDFFFNFFTDKFDFIRYNFVGSFVSPLDLNNTLSKNNILPSFKETFFNFEILQDWRMLKLEREVWRTADMLTLARQSIFYRKKFYSNFYDPATLMSKVSIWLPNQLIPGWAFITPYTSRLRYTTVGKVDIALVVVFVASLGSIFSSVNYVITYRYLGAPSLKNRREVRSFFVDALLVGSRMILLANPALLIGILLLLSDRHFNTSVFDFSGGGDTVLFQHLFWFFGHPEVYIIIIPCFGFMNSLLPHYLRKRLSGRLSLQFSMYTIAFMGFAVWGHHLYMVGLANSVRTLYSTMTVMISVPASTKVLHWCVTLIQSTFCIDVGFLFLLAFMYFFVLGGLSGMFVAHIGFDTIFHDTFYVIGHFHVMLAGAAMSCLFAGFYFYFPSIFGVRYSRFFAYMHFIFYVSGQLLTLIPMFWLGYAGMPRRIMDYPSVFGGWHSIISSGHILTFLGLVFFLLMLLDSFYENRSPILRHFGVNRLNTRMGFYFYESRKLNYYRTKSLPLLRTSNVVSTKSNIYYFGSKSELSCFVYSFLK